MGDPEREEIQMRNASRGLRYWLALTVAVGVIAAPVAPAAPVDPAIPGSASSPAGLSQQRGVSALPPPQASSVAGDGFDWGDAVIGAGAAFALTMIGLGGMLVVGIRRRGERRAAAV
jgi:hypothetical protein